MKVKCKSCSKQIDVVEGVESKPYAELRVWDSQPGRSSHYAHGYFCSADCVRVALELVLLQAGLTGEKVDQ